MKVINAVGSWQICELDNQDPIEYFITNGERVFYNRDKEAALRLAQYIDTSEKENKDLQAA